MDGRRAIQQPSALLRRQPVPELNADAAHAFDAPNAGGELRAQKSGIGGFIRDPADGREPQVDGRSFTVGSHLPLQRTHLGT